MKKPAGKEAANGMADGNPKPKRVGAEDEE